MSDRRAFESRYGLGLNIAGEFTGGDLADDGELIELQDRDGDVLVRMAYGDSGPWPERADGRGSTLELVDPTGSAADPAHSRASTWFGGTPGAVAGAVADRVVINELLAGATAPAEDAVELYNTGATPIDMGGWYISNSDDDYARFRVPSGTILPGQGYRVFDESQLGFSFDGAHGGSVWLVSADTVGRPLWFVDHVLFPASPQGVSMGAWPTRDDPWLGLAEPTWGRANSGPWIGEVVISEVHYHPVDPDGAGRLTADQFEFVELYNGSDVAVDIGQWRLAGGTEYVFPVGTVVNPGQSLVLVGFDPADERQASIFRFTFGLAPTALLWGPWTAALDDSGGSVWLEAPVELPAMGLTSASGVRLDQVHYRANPPWPAEAAGNGDSLTRTQASDHALLLTSWIAAAPSPGGFQPLARIPGDANQDGRFDRSDLLLALEVGTYMTGMPASWSAGDWTGDGLFDQRDVVFALEQAFFELPIGAARR